MNTKSSILRRALSLTNHTHLLQRQIAELHQTALSLSQEAQRLYADAGDLLDDDEPAGEVDLVPVLQASLERMRPKESERPSGQQLCAGAVIAAEEKR